MAPHSEESQYLVQLAVALGIGMLIGLDGRGQSPCISAEERAVGIRTFGIIGLLGGVTVELGSSSMTIVVTLATIILLAVGYWRGSAQQRAARLANSVAGMLSLFLGALAGGGRLTLAASSALVFMLLLRILPKTSA